MSPNEVLVRVAELQVGTGETELVTIALGSCVAIVLHDPVSRVGGVAHVLLPSPSLIRRTDNPAKFPSTAVPRLLALMTEAGAKPGRVTARLAGGASMFAALASPGTIHMGERNLIASRQALTAGGVPLVAEAVGGEFGRTVRLRVFDGRLEVHSVAHGTRVL